MTQDPAPAAAWRLSAWALVAALFALGQATLAGGAGFSTFGLLWTAVALGLGLTIVAGITDRSRSEPAERVVVAFGAAVFAAQILQLTQASLARLSSQGGPPASWLDRYGFPCALLVAGAVGLAALYAPPGRQKGLTILLLAIHLALGAWILRSRPQPKIDVFVFQQEASRELAAGGNPYRLAMPNIYDEQESAKLYAPGWWSGDRLRFGFPYPPVSLLLAFPGFLFGGDHRFAQLLAITGAGATLAFLRPGRFGTLAAALFLFTPRGFDVLERGWTEPFSVLLFVLFLRSAVSAPRGRHRLLGGLLGLLLASKQYLLLIAPLLALLTPWSLPARRLPRLALQALGVAAAVTLPFVLWDPAAFYSSVVAVHLAQPYRPDSLTFLALLPEALARSLTILSPLAALGVLCLALARAPRTATGFAAAAAVTLLAFFTWSKQAHANYFYLVLGLLGSALAVVAPADAD